MEKHFENSITALAPHPTRDDGVALGFIDGRIECYVFNVSRKSLTKVWDNKLKRGIRGLHFSEDADYLYVICANRAVCVFDGRLGNRLRCIVRGHENKPTTISILPSTEELFNVVTGSESGEIKIWDFRQSKSIITTFHDQSDDINEFGHFKRLFVAASSDHTLASYDFRRRKVQQVSEKMHSELMSLEITDKYTFAGGLDGHVEIFNSGEYGNLLERMETPFTFGIDAITSLRPNLLLVASSNSDEMRFCNINPNKQLHSLPKQGGVDVLVQSKNHLYLMYVCGDTCTFGVKSISKLIDKIPILNQNNTINDLVKTSKNKINKKLRILEDSDVDEEDEDDINFFNGLEK